jgi:hypothetical protein
MAFMKIWQAKKEGWMWHINQGSWKVFEEQEKRGENELKISVIRKLFNELERRGELVTHNAQNTCQKCKSHA